MLHTIRKGRSAMGHVAGMNTRLILLVVSLRICVWACLSVSVLTQQKNAQTHNRNFAEMLRNAMNDFVSIRDGCTLQLETEPLNCVLGKTADAQAASAQSVAYVWDCSQDRHGRCPCNH